MNRTDEYSSPGEWTIGRLAAAVGITPRTLRHYDDRGILPPTRRSASGYRIYDEQAASRLYQIVALRHLGFGLDEVRAVLDAPDADDKQERLRSTAKRHLELLEREIAAAARLRDRLMGLVSSADGEPATAPDILEATSMTIELNRITTRTGDAGQTGLASGKRAAKAHPRVEALGAVDQLNAQIGVALAQPDIPEEHALVLDRIQQRLFDLGADLAQPNNIPARRARVDEAEVAWVEETIEPLTRTLPPLDSFVLPRGGPYSAQLHVCRTACRSAERRVVAMMADLTDHVGDGNGTPPAVPYLNRLSDLFFLLARAASLDDEELWMPLPKALDSNHRSVKD